MQIYQPVCMMSASASGDGGYDDVNGCDPHEGYGAYPNSDPGQAFGNIDFGPAGTTIIIIQVTAPFYWTTRAPDIRRASNIADVGANCATTGSASIVVVATATAVDPKDAIAVARVARCVVP